MIECIVEQMANVAHNRNVLFPFLHTKFPQSAFSGLLPAATVLLVEQNYHSRLIPNKKKQRKKRKDYLLLSRLLECY